MDQERKDFERQSTIIPQLEFIDDSYEENSKNEITEASRQEATSPEIEECTVCGSSCPKRCERSLYHIECDINKRLELFIKIFVNQFEQKLNSYVSEVTPGNKTIKAGKTSEIVALASGALIAIPVVGKALSVLSSAPIIYLGKRYHRKKAKRIVEMFRYKEDEEFLLKKKEIRRMLVEAAGDIFRSFECQFIAVTGISESWARAMEKLAVDAMNRSIYYIDEYKDNNPSRKISNCVITKGIICCKFKESATWIPALLQKKPKPGHTIQDKNSNQEWKTTELYDKTGIIKDKGDIIEYYKKRGYANNFGYRLPLNWELQEWEELQQKYEFNNQPSTEYTYFLKTMDINKKSENILAAINKEDPILKLDRIEEGVDNIKEETREGFKGASVERQNITKAIEATREENRDNKKEHKKIQQGIKKVEEVIVDNSNKLSEIHEIVISQKIEQIKGPIWFDIQDPVETFTGREKELIELHNKIQRNSEKSTIISQMTSICGLGGIGKSELARKYAYIYQNDYDGNIIWINAENNSTLENSFLNLAKDCRLNIPIKDKDGKEKTIQTIIKDIYIFFAKRKSLFIFDNAEKYKTQKREDGGIDRFLPSSLQSNVYKPKFLITSRNQEWGNIHIIQLNTFTKREATEFIKNTLNINEKIQNIKKLAETLQYFPLALQQAVAYIKERDDALKNIGSKFDICDYLKRYHKQTKKLLNFKFPDDSSNLYTKTNFTTWKITVDKIRENDKCGKQAGEILDIIAYFAPDNIPIQIFLRSELIDDDIEKLGDAIKLLKKYSMVNSGQKQTSLNIHRLVQQVTRINLNEQNKDEIIINEAFKLIKENFPYMNNKVEDYTAKRELLPHLEAFLSHIYDWITKKPELKQKIEKDYLESLLKWMSDGYDDLGNTKRQKELLETALKIKENYYGRDHIELTNILVKLSKAFGNLGDPQKGKELLERALIIEENHYSHDQTEVARTLANLGNAYGFLEDHQKHKELLERAYEIKVNHYGRNHIEIASTLVNLGNAYGDLRDHQKKKELIEWAFKIEEEYYDPDHIEIAITLTNLANVYGNLDDPQKKKELLEKALKIKENYYGNDHFEIARTLVHLASAYGDLDDPQKKKDLLEQALKIEENHYGDDHFEVARTLVSLSNVYGHLSNIPKQKELLERAVKINENHYGLNHIEVAKILSDLNNAYGLFGDPPKKKMLLERILKIEENFYGPDHFKIIHTLVNLSLIYGILGDLQKKKEVLERLLKIEENHYGHDHSEVARTLINLGNIYGDLGDRQKQKVLLEQGFEIIENYYGSDHYEVATQLSHLGNFYGTLGDLQKRKDLLERALKIEVNHYGPDNFMVSETSINLGNAYGDLNDHQKAYELYEKASKITKETTLHYAFQNGNINTIKYIVENGSDILARNKHDTVLHQAVNNGGEEIITLILEKIKEMFSRDSQKMYESINAKDTDGDTPLMWASQYGNTKIVKILLNYGADINARNNDGETALNWASKGGYRDLELLLDKIAKAP